MQRQLTDEDVAASLKEPIPWMEMARILRKSADLLERKVVGSEIAHLKEHRARDEKVEIPAAELAKLRSTQRDSDYHRVSGMLYQMSYENALKGLITLQGGTPPSEHDLMELVRAAGLSVSEETKRYLDRLSRMNQLGRYRVGRQTIKVEVEGQKPKSVRKEVFGTFWSRTQLRHRKALDHAISVKWISSKGPMLYADIVSRGT